MLSRLGATDSFAMLIDHAGKIRRHVPHLIEFMQCLQYSTECKYKAPSALCQNKDRSLLSPTRSPILRVRSHMVDLCVISKEGNHNKSILVSVAALMPVGPVVGAHLLLLVRLCAELKALASITVTFSCVT
jgi:hypothetical protein